MTWIDRRNPVRSAELTAGALAPRSHPNGRSEMRLLAMSVAMALLGCSGGSRLPGPALENRSETESAADVAACQLTMRKASVVLSLKNPNSYTLGRLLLEPHTEVKKGGVVVRVVALTTDPVRVRYGGRERDGLRVTLAAELTGASDRVGEAYETSVTLPHAIELSYWGGFTTPTFKLTGTIRPPDSGRICPLASLPKPPSSPPLRPPGMLREMWTTVRGFTKWEAVQATLVLPLVGFGAGKGLSHFKNPLLQIWMLAMWIVAWPCAILAFVRLVFLWP
jgi:hypothetical protein